MKTTNRATRKGGKKATASQSVNTTKIGSEERRKPLSFDDMARWRVLLNQARKTILATRSRDPELRKMEKATIAQIERILAKFDRASGSEKRKGGVR